MKYWLFDGEDVIGPFSPQELAARPGFSAASMIAPETQSEDQQAWQVASSFADFELNEETGQLEAKQTQSVVQPSSEEQLEKPAEKPNPVEDKPVQPVVHKEPDPVKPIPLASPIALSEETEEILPLPVQTQIPAQTLDLSQAAPEQLDNSAPEEEKEISKNQENEQEQEPEVSPASTLPLANDKEQLAYGPSSLPTVDQLAAATVQDVSVAPWNEQEEAPTPSQAPVESLEPEELTKQAESSVEPEIQIQESVKPTLKPTTEINAFLHSQEKANQPHRRNATVMLWVLLVLLLPGLVALTIHFMPPKKQPVKESTIVPEKKVEEKSVAAAPKEEIVPVVASAPQIVPPPAVTEPIKSTSADKAVEIVKNYKLAENKGTLSSYLNRLYKTQLASGYSGQWSAEPLHKSIYIVKYRLTKTRTEPIVYVFQADVSKGKLTGALNNIALDLVGKI